tara:strand:+ start:317 stop:1048 length:732 start_codon:yes stop_codon:yes gene_type:complete
MNKSSWITYLCDNTFLEGVICLKNSIEKVKSNFSLICMITDDVSNNTVKILNNLNIKTILVEKIYPERLEGIKDRYSNKSWMMFTKINVWSLTDYDKLIYLDADTLMLRNSDVLFEIKDNFCAVKDPGYNGINAGVMVLTPNKDIFNEMKSLINSKDYDNTYSDQSFTNWFYCVYKKDIKYLPYCYNVLQKRTSCAEFYNDICIFHYNGQKPWISDKSNKCCWQQGKNIEYDLWFLNREYSGQ